MQLHAKTCGAVLTLGLVSGLASAMSGCDSGAGGGEPADKKYIESNILKKLGGSGQAVSDEAKQKAVAARAKKKK
jgi:hypothetical protein